MTLSLPSWSSASFIARIEPSASPSGFSWVTMRKRSCDRIASATAATSLVVWGELIDQLRHAGPPLDGRIVFDRGLRRPLHPELARQPRLQDAVRRLEAGEALLAALLGSEHAYVDTCVAQVRRGLDPGDGDETDPRVLQLADRFGEDLPDGLVDAPHAAAHVPYSSGDRSRGVSRPRTTTTAGARGPDLQRRVRPGRHRRRPPTRAAGRRERDSPPVRRRSAPWASGAARPTAYMPTRWRRRSRGALRMTKTRSRFASLS